MSSPPSNRCVDFYLLRHGHSQRYGSQQQRLNARLTPLGQQQAQHTAEWLEQNLKVDALYTSDLPRAIETARPIATALNLRIHQYATLREFGGWSAEGKAISLTDTTPTKREVWQGFTQRIAVQMNLLAIAHVTEQVLIVTHGGVFDAMMGRVLKWQNHSQGMVAITNHVGLSHFRLEGASGCLRLKFHNQLDHLPAPLQTTHTA